MRENILTLPEPANARVRKSDWAVAGALLTLPLWVFFAMMIIGGAITLRYVLPTVIDFGISIPLLLNLCIGKQRVLMNLASGWVFVAALLALEDLKFELREISDLRQGTGSDYLLKIADKIPRDNLPIVMTELHEYGRMKYYSPDHLQQRLVFLTGFHEWSKILSVTRPNSETNKVKLSSADFLGSNEEFYLYVPNNVPDNSLPFLLSRGATVEEIGLNDVSNIYPRPGYILKVKFSK